MNDSEAKAFGNPGDDNFAREMYFPTMVFNKISDIFLLTTIVEDDAFACGHGDCPALAHPGSSRTRDSGLGIKFQLQIETVRGPGIE